MGKLGSASHHPLLPYDLTRANGSNGPGFAQADIARAGWSPYC